MKDDSFFEENFWEIYEESYLNTSQPLDEDVLRKIDQENIQIPLTKSEDFNFFNFESEVVAANEKIDSKESESWENKEPESEPIEESKQEDDEGSIIVISDDEFDDADTEELVFSSGYSSNSEKYKIVIEDSDEDVVNVTFGKRFKTKEISRRYEPTSRVKHVFTDQF